MPYRCLQRAGEVAMATNIYGYLAHVGFSNIRKRRIHKAVSLYLHNKVAKYYTMTLIAQIFFYIGQNLNPQS